MPRNARTIFPRLMKCRYTSSRGLALTESSPEGLADGYHRATGIFQAPSSKKSLLVDTTYGPLVRRCESSRASPPPGVHAAARGARKPRLVGAAGGCNPTMAPSCSTHARVDRLPWHGASPPTRCALRPSLCLEASPLAGATKPSKRPAHTEQATKATSNDTARNGQRLRSGRDRRMRTKLPGRALHGGERCRILPNGKRRGAQGRTRERTQVACS